MWKTNYSALEVYEKNFDELKRKIEHKELYNARTFAIRMLINCGVGVDYCLPFLVSAFVVFNIFTEYFNNSPFVKDEVVNYASIQTTYTSSGIHLEKTSYDYNYSAVKFEHSTGWKMGEDGLYERVATSYMTEGIDFNDIDQVFSMSMKEIEEKFIVNNIKTIKKNNLLEEDKIYDEECLVITRGGDSETDFIMKEESDFANFLSSALYVLATVIGGGTFLGVSKIFIKDPVRCKLKKYRENYFYVSEKDLGDLKEIFRIRKENIDLLKEDSVIPNYQLRRK